MSKKLNSIFPETIFLRKDRDYQTRIEICKFSSNNSDEFYNPKRHITFEEWKKNNKKILETFYINNSNEEIK